MMQKSPLGSLFQAENNSLSYQIENILIGGDAYLEEVLLSLSKAKHSVDFEVYIFAECQTGLKILESLGTLVSQGVKVRLLVDGIGSLTHLTWIEKHCLKKNIEFRIYNPVFTFKSFWHWNRRDHRKVIIIDDEVAFVGSINISPVHFKEETKKPWIDFALKASGQSVGILKLAFNKAWEHNVKGLRMSMRYSTKAWRRIYLSQSFSRYWHVNFNFLLRFRNWFQLLSQISKAQKRIWIINAYFVPHRSFLQKIARAAKAGVDVKIILPAKSDVPLVRWASLGFYKYLLVRKVQIFEYTQTMLHTKSMIIDDWAVIGSHNLNHRSLIHDLEVEGVVQGESPLAKLEEAYVNIIESSQQITLSSFDEKNWFFWLKCRLAMIFKYWI